MANPCESAQGSLARSKPKGLIGLNQKVRWQESCPIDHGSRSSTTRSTHGCLRSRTPKAELVNPEFPPRGVRVRSSLPDRRIGETARVVPTRLSPSRQADRKESRRGCRKGCWNKRMPGCNGSDTSSEFARRESEQTSSWCLIARESGEPMNERMTMDDPERSAVGALSSMKKPQQSVDWQAYEAIRLQVSTAKASQGAGSSFPRPLRYLSGVRLKSHAPFLEGWGTGNGPLATRREPSGGDYLRRASSMGSR